MSKVESSDELRIRELQEAQRRAEARSREADGARRGERSFQEALRARAGQENAAQGDRADAERRGNAERRARRALEGARPSRGAAPSDLAQRAALARGALTRGALERRAVEARADGGALADRADHHDATATRERTQVETRLRDDDAQEREVRDERQAALRQEALDGRIGEELAHGRRERRQRDRREDERRDPSTEVVSAAPPSAPGSGAAPALPPALLERWIRTIVEVVEDGRSRLELRLQGRGLDGVVLEIRSEGGRISCAFTGCSDRFRRDVLGAEQALRDGLARRGLALEQLTAR